MNVPTFIFALGGVIAVLSALAGIVGYMRANVSKSTIELYRQDNDALRARLQTLEEDSAAKDIQIKALVASRDFLTSVVTQAEAIADIRRALTTIDGKVDRIASKVGA